MILDTNALSGLAEGSRSVGLALADAQEIAVPVIVLGEYRYGVMHSSRRQVHEAWLVRTLPAFRILEITIHTTLEYAAIRSELRKLGTPIPANDFWIAALGREHHLPILSRDRHFDCVKGLRRIEW